MRPVDSCPKVRLAGYRGGRHASSQQDIWAPRSNHWRSETRWLGHMFIYVITNNGRGVKSESEASDDRRTGSRKSRFQSLQAVASTSFSHLSRRGCSDTAWFVSMRYDLPSNRDCKLFFVVATELFRNHVTEDVLFARLRKFVLGLFFGDGKETRLRQRRNAGDKASIAATSRDIQNIPGRLQLQRIGINQRISLQTRRELVCKSSV